MIDLKINNSSLFDVDYKNKLSLAKDAWGKFSDHEKELFQNEETYTKFLLLKQIDFVPTNFDSISNPLKEFFLELKKNSKNLIEQIEKENNKVTKSPNILKNILQYSKNNDNTNEQFFMKYLEFRKNLDNYIIEEIIKAIFFQYNRRRAL